MIVDDEPSIREILSFLFKKKKWTVVVAEDGYSALEMYEKHKPGVILTDINMPQRADGSPGLNGIEFIESMKSKYKDNLPLIYVMSGFLDNKEKVEQLKVVSAYFEKPDLTGAVTEIISKCI
jgi:CheY-like chemotaxis protein